jgi:hypothetical protein
MGLRLAAWIATYMLASPLNSGKIKRRIVFVLHAFESKFYSCSCRAAIYASLAQLVKIPYLQLQAKGLLTGKFTLHAQTPVVVRCPKHP